MFSENCCDEKTAELTQFSVEFVEQIKKIDLNQNNNSNIYGWCYSCNSKWETGKKFTNCPFCENKLPKETIKPTPIEDFVISNGVLYSYSGNESKVVIPNGVKIIKNSAFRQNNNLKTIIISYGVEQILNGAFNNCSKLTEVVMPNSLYYIGEWAFDSCKKLKKINLPESLIYIDNFAFQSCENLKSITIPYNLYKIESRVFNNCDNLTDVNFKNTDVNISGNVFEGCKKLSEKSKKSIEKAEIYTLQAFYKYQVEYWDTIRRPATDED